MQTTRLGRLLLAALAAGGLIGSAHADFKKVGYVNATRLYSESQTAKKIETGLQREFSPQQKKLAALQEKGMRLQKRLASGKLSKAEARKLESQLVETGRQYRAASAELTEEYNLRRNEEFAALQRKANEIIFNIIETEHYDAMLSEVIFIRGEFDITDRVIKLLDPEMQ